MTWIFLVVGLVLLVVGADLLVKGAARLAGSFGIPALVIGLTVVAFGTSAPELAVSVKAAYSGQAGIPRCVLYRPAGWLYRQYRRNIPNAVQRQCGRCWKIANG